MRHSPFTLSQPAIRTTVRSAAGTAHLRIERKDTPTTGWIALRINAGPTPLATHAAHYPHEIHLQLARELVLSLEDHVANLPSVVADPVAWEIANALLAAAASQHAIMPLVTLLLGSIPRPRAASLAAREAGSLMPWQVLRLDRAIQAGLTRKLSLSHLARECRLSVCHFSRAFKATYGVTAHQYVVSERIRHAQRRLMQTEASIAQVALDCGFPDQSSFTRRFAAVTGKSPALWRRERTPIVRPFEMPHDHAQHASSAGDLLCA